MSQVVISGQMNYSDPAVQAQVENLTQTFENTTYISSPLYTESWLRSFVGYVHRNQDYLNVSIDTEDGFIRALKEVTCNFVYISSYLVANLAAICSKKPKHDILR
jgi:hypothetical protein